MSSQTFRKLPAFFYKKLVLPKVRKANARASQAIPKHELSDIHLKNAKLITTREELLRTLPQNGIVAELGVDEGDFSNLILTLNKPKKLHLVDFWGSKRYNQEKRKKVEGRFQKHLEDKTVEINLGLSTTVVDDFQDDYFDWVYVDTSHSYKTTFEELERYSKKVKKGGYIAGHDYVIGNWDGLVCYGVIEAVYEFCVKHNWEIAFLTSELNDSPSFAIRRISEVHSS